MYYHTTKVSDAKLIHQKHPNSNLDSIARLIMRGLESDDIGVNTAIYVSEEGFIEYCSLEFYKNNEDRFGKQEYLNTKIKY